jgi:hypothetical protein
MNKTILILAIAAAFVAGTITTTALVYAHGGDGSLIHACASKSTGALRYVAPHVTCKSGENSVDWPQIALPGPQGIQGDQGDKGDTGEKGETGPAGGTSYVETAFTPVAPEEFGVANAHCDTGDEATGGGFGPWLHDFQLFASGPTGSSPTGWAVHATNIDIESSFVIAHVVCRDLPPLRP